MGQGRLHRRRLGRTPHADILTLGRGLSRRMRDGVTTGPRVHAVAGFVRDQREDGWRSSGESADLLCHSDVVRTGDAGFAETGTRSQPHEALTPPPTGGGGASRRRCIRRTNLVVLQHLPMHRGLAGSSVDRPVPPCPGVALQWAPAPSTNRFCGTSCTSRRHHMVRDLRLPYRKWASDALRDLQVMTAP